MSPSNVLGPGNTALVTGASRGIGTLIAREIANGHHFPFNDDPDRYTAAISTWWAGQAAKVT